jgi:hypothetical protein
LGSDVLLFDVEDCAEMRSLKRRIEKREGGVEHSAVE